MPIKIKNNAFGVLLTGITSTGTSITLQTGQGANFPSLVSGDYFYATLIDNSNNLEIVKVTAIASDVLTVVRGQESTTARAYSAGDRIELRITAQALTDFVVPGDGTITTVMLADNNVTDAKLSTSGVTASTYGSSTAIPVITVNNKGRVTAASTAALDASYGLQFFTSSNASWSIPASALKVTVIGGGGNGGTSTGSAKVNAAGAGGGGGGAVSIRRYTGLTIGASASITVGAAANASSFTAGGVTITANGGANGGSTSTTTAGAGGAGGTASGGSINISGQAGTSGDAGGDGGAGGIGYGYPGGGVPDTGSGSSAIGYGAGGSGGNAGTNTTRSGGSGGPGLVIVEW